MVKKGQANAVKIKKGDDSRFWAAAFEESKTRDNFPAILEQAMKQLKDEGVAMVPERFAEANEILRAHQLKMEQN